MFAKCRHVALRDERQAVDDTQLRPCWSLRRSLLVRERGCRVRCAARACEPDQLALRTPNEARLRGASSNDCLVGRDSLRGIELLEHAGVILQARTRAVAQLARDFDDRTPLMDEQSREARAQISGTDVLWQTSRLRGWSKDPLAPG